MFSLVYSGLLLPSLLQIRHITFRLQLGGVVIFSFRRNFYTFFKSNLSDITIHSNKNSFLYALKPRDISTKLWQNPSVFRHFVNSTSKNRGILLRARNKNVIIIFDIQDCHKQILLQIFRDSDNFCSSEPENDKKSGVFQHIEHFLLFSPKSLCFS